MDRVVLQLPYFLFVGMSLPSFDMNAALIVGAIVAAVAAVVIVVAIATPFVAISAGASLIGTGLAITGIALVVGVLGGVAAGMYWGHTGDIEQAERIEQIAAISNQFHVRFVPSAGDPDKAAEFECTILTYSEADLTSRPPKVVEESSHLSGTNGTEFYSNVETKVRQWFAMPLLADGRDDVRRQITIFMEPYPGEGFYRRIDEIIKQTSEGQGKPFTVKRSDGPWQSALPNPSGP